MAIIYKKNWICTLRKNHFHSIHSWPIWSYTRDVFNASMGLNWARLSFFLLKLYKIVGSEVNFRRKDWFICGMEKLEVVEIMLQCNVGSRPDTRIRSHRRCNSWDLLGIWIQYYSTPRTINQIVKTFLIKNLTEWSHSWTSIGINIWYFQIL